MYEEFVKWLDSVLDENMPFKGAKGICFNLYEEGDDEWSVQLVATSRFDMDDDDWACDEIFSTEENLYIWKEKAKWEDIQSEASGWVMEYLESGKHAEEFKPFEGLGVGFVDGDITLFLHDSEKNTIA